MDRLETPWPASRVTRLGFLAAAGTALFVIESFIPLPIPFLKIGLANISTLLALYLMGRLDPLRVVMLRVAAGSLLTGSLFTPSFLLALGAGIFSALAMTGLHRTGGGRIGPVGLSLAGATVHVVTQLALVGLLLVHHAGVVRLLPILLATGIAGGLVVGLVTSRLLPVLASLPTLPASLSGDMTGKFRAGDGIVALLCAVALGASLALSPGAAGKIVLVEVNGMTVGRLDLQHDESLVVHGTAGIVTVEVRNGKVGITEADCPNGVCVRSGWKDRAGDIIVCVPNKTVVRITGDADHPIMGVTG